MICTTIEQSKKLLELGIDPKTADMCYIKREINYTFIETPIVKPQGELPESLPAWSLTALCKLMPAVRGKRKISEYPRLLKNCLTSKFYFGSLVYCADEHDEPVDAAVDMIKNLIFRGYIIKGK